MQSFALLYYKTSINDFVRLHRLSPPSRIISSSHSHMAQSLAPSHRPSRSLTLQAADPPETRVGEGSRVLLVLVVRVVLRGVGSAVADEGASVQPVVCADGHGHQGEGCERSNGGKKHLNPPLAPHHG